MKRHFLRKLAVFPLRLYKKFISPSTPPACRFSPACSEYAMTAILRFGILRGWLMAICRLLRCNPWCRGGIDPVPSRFTLRPFAGAEPSDLQNTSDPEDPET